MTGARAKFRWRTSVGERLIFEKIVEGRWVDKPDLAHVDEIGFTDVMTGGGSDACSRVDWIEVWARRLPRTPR